jgi:NAD(P)H-hydrate epimerase
VTILTPHEGEFSRLTGAKVTNRIDDAMNAASEFRSIVVLKGHNTVITDGANCFVNPTGNPGMAVGGSGDVLAGMICALVGQGIAPLHAAACGVWLHGAAGDLCAEQLGQYAMLPSDMLMYLPRLLK